MSQQHSQRITRTTAGVMIAAAIASGAAGQALAAPPGSAPPSGDTAPGSAPATPTPPPPPVARGRSIIPTPTYDAPVLYEGTPGYTPPVYSGSYNPVPPVLRAPRPVKPVNPVLPRPGVIKLGNFRTPQPAWLSDADARNLNGQAATIEARTATYYESIGFPADQAARTAASTTVGVLIGGTAGAIALGIPAAVVGGVVGAPVGAGIGAIAGAVVGLPTGTSAVLAGPGALIGLGVGTGVGIAAGAAGGAALGAGIGGVIGGAIGYAVGAGDPGGDPNAPLGATNEDPRKSKVSPPNPDANQYELHRKGPGTDNIDYVVAKNGDVSGRVKIGAVDVPIAIGHAQADAPFQAAGVFAQTARDSVAAAVADFGRTAQRAFPGLTIDYPQFTPAQAAGKHRR